MTGGRSLLQENSVPGLYTETLVTDSLEASDAFKDTLEGMATDSLGALDVFKDTFEGIPIEGVKVDITDAVTGPESDVSTTGAVVETGGVQT